MMFNNNNSNDVITLSDDEESENSGTMRARNSNNQQNKMLTDLMMSMKQHPSAAVVGAGATLSIINERPLDLDSLLPSKTLKGWASRPPAPSPLQPQHTATVAATKKTNDLHEQIAMFYIERQQQHEATIRDAILACSSGGSAELQQMAPQQMRVPKRPPSMDMRLQQAFGPPPRTMNHQIFEPPEKRPHIDMAPQLHLKEPHKIKNGFHQNGHIALTNGHLFNGKRMILGNRSAEEISRFCKTYIEASDKKTSAMFSINDEEIGGVFECTYQSCGKRLKNNIQFVIHAWAHVVLQKPAENEEQCTNLQILLAEHNGNGIGDGGINPDEQRYDVTRLHTCPECLLEQPNPHRLQLHYHRVHKRGERLLLDGKPELNVCNICEHVIGTQYIVQHMAAHHLSGPNKNVVDLPYGCRFAGGGRKCRYKTSNRGALLQHFCTKHSGTHVLLCPFCLATFAVPATEKRSPLIRMREFMRHMLLHDAEKSRHCSQCVVKIPHSLETQMNQHQEAQHSPQRVNKWLQWQMQRLDLNTVEPEKSHAQVSTDMHVQQCIECGSGVRNLRKHLSTELKACTFCTYRTYCARAMERHQLLSMCNPANEVRRPFAAVDSSGTSSSGTQNLKCSRCEFRTVDVQLMGEHTLRDEEGPCYGAEIILLPTPTTDIKMEDENEQFKQEPELKSEFSGDDKLADGMDKMELLSQNDKKFGRKAPISEEELHEARLFGLLCMADAPEDEVEEQWQRTEEEEDGASEDARALQAERRARFTRLNDFVPQTRAHELSQHGLQPAQQLVAEHLLQLSDDEDLELQRAKLRAEERRVRAQMRLAMSDLRLPQRQKISAILQSE